MNRAMLAMWRLGLGRTIGILPGATGWLLVLVHRGRSTGRRLKTPLDFAWVEGDIFVVAAFGERSDWYRNVVAHSEVEVWLPTTWWRGRAEDASDTPNRLDLMRAVLRASGFAAPLVGLHPKVMTDEELAATTGDYRLIRIRPVERIDRPADAEDLVWVWLPVIAVGLVAWLARRALGRARSLRDAAAGR